jgi:cytochrome c-type biogenesis protein
MAPEPFVSFVVAFFAGLASFLSPCILPLVPAFLAYLAGSAATFDGRDGVNMRSKAFLNAFVFVAGFTLVFVAFGLSASAIGRFLIQHQLIVQRASGAAIVFFGLSMAGVLRIGAMGKEKHLAFKWDKGGWVGSLLLGMAFSAGWTPCVGPILASILIMAGSSASMRYGALLLAVYSLGLALPFLAAAASLGWLENLLKRHSEKLALVTKIGGWVLVAIGVLMATGTLSRLSGMAGALL